jgi:glutathione synthase/RimK-type ligase-like ATP-grasp enzyme
VRLVYLEDDQPDWHDFTGVCVVMAWSYPKVIDQFLAALEGIKAAGVPLVNGQATVQKNFDKAYLDDLAALGVPVPRTLTLASADPAAIIASFDRLGCDDVVIKPAIGGGAWRQVRLKRGEAVPDAEELPPASTLVQPFLSGVPKLGELSVLAFDGQVSHALSKVPVAGDYRTQGFYGAVETSIAVPASAHAVIEQTLHAWHALTGESLTYARFDLVPADDSTDTIAEVTNWLVMELEVIEPYLYLGNRPDSSEAGAADFATALVKALRS